VEAIRNANDALQKRDLRNGLNGLEALRRAYGDSERLNSAIADYKNKRAQIANEMLTRQSRRPRMLFKRMTAPGREEG